MAMLEVKDISVYYGVIQAINGISFEVNQGEIVTLIGANGADAKPIFALQIEYYAPFVEFLNVDALLRAQLHLVLVSHHDAQKSLFAL